MLRVCVIIPVFDDARRLALCLDALAAQTMPVDEFEVIVVDNGSPHPPHEVVGKYAFARLLQEPQPGSYAARNCGLAVCRSPVVAFTDADCLPSPNWLAAGTVAIEQTQRKVVVSGPIEIFPRDPASPTGAELYDIAFGLDQQANMRSGFFPTANLFVARAAFDEVGLFDSRLLSGSDSAWCKASAEQGYLLKFVESAVVRHPARESLAALIRQARRFVGGRLDRGQRRNPLSLHYWRVVLRTVVPNVSKMIRARRLLSGRGYGTRNWLQTLPVILAIQYSRLFEFLRKCVGCPSERT